MCKLPNLVVLTSGVGVGSSKLNAYDSALLNSNIGNFNLVQVSSIIPPKAKVYYYEECKDIILNYTHGLIIPVVYTSIISEKKGETIASALGAGVPIDESKNGVIFETSLVGSEQVARENVSFMINEAMLNRNIKHYSLLLISAEAKVKSTIMCTLCAAILLETNLGT